MANREQKLIDVGQLDIKKILRAMIDVKKQNAQLFDAIKRLDKHDKHFEEKVKVLFYIAGNIRTSTEREMVALEHLLVNVEENKVDEKFLDKIASVNKPNNESVKYGQALISLRKSFLNMAVKRASDNTRDNKSSDGDDSGRKQS
jgi:predicted transcriptional regulator